MDDVTDWKDLALWQRTSHPTSAFLLTGQQPFSATERE